MLSSEKDFGLRVNVNVWASLLLYSIYQSQKQQDQPYVCNPINTCDNGILVNKSYEIVDILSKKKQNKTKTSTEKT